MGRTGKNKPAQANSQNVAGGAQLAPAWRAGRSRFSSALLKAEISTHVPGSDACPLDGIIPNPGLCCKEWIGRHPSCNPEPGSLVAAEAVPSLRASEARPALPLPCPALPGPCPGLPCPLPQPPTDWLSPASTPQTPPACLPGYPPYSSTPTCMWCTQLRVKSRKCKLAQVTMMMPSRA